MFKTVLLATDGAPDGDNAVRNTIELARVHRSRVTVVHVSDSAVTPEDVHDQVEQLRSAGIPTRLAVIGDAAHPAAAIAAFATALGADIVITATGNGEPNDGPSLVGRVAQRIPAMVSCPVLAVPASGRRL